MAGRDVLVAAGVPLRAFLDCVISVEYPRSLEDVERVKRDEAAVAAARARDRHDERGAGTCWIRERLASLVHRYQGEWLSADVEAVRAAPRASSRDATAGEPICDLPPVERGHLQILSRLRHPIKRLVRRG